MQRLNVCSVCTTDSVMRHISVAYMGHDDEGDYVAYADARAEIERLTKERDDARTALDPHSRTALASGGRV